MISISAPAGLLALAAACSPNFHPQACSTDADCGSPVCKPGRATDLHLTGIGDDPRRDERPDLGPSQDLGTQMKLGVTLAIDGTERRGRHSRPSVELDFRDDEYQPSLAEENARALTDVQTMNGSPRCPTTTNTTITGNPQVSSTALNRGPNAVLAFLGNVGTPTMVRAAPVSLETNTLFFGAFTGANTILRDTSAGSCANYIFNVRASYAQEARATLEFFLNQGVPDSKHLVSFDQNDSFGDAGYKGLLAAYTALKGAFPWGRRRRPSRASATRATTAPVCPLWFKGSRPTSPGSSQPTTPPTPSVSS